MTATGLIMLIGGYGAAYAASGVKSPWPMVLSLVVTAAGAWLFMTGLIIWIWRTLP